MTTPHAFIRRATRAVHEQGDSAWVVRAAVAPIVGEPRVSAPQISQATAGHTLLPLRREGDWCRVRGGDDYEGWIHAGYLIAAGDLPTGWREWVATARLSLGARVNGPYGARELPLGALLLPGEEPVSGDCAGSDGLHARFPADAGALLATAMAHFTGSSYQWGGVTPWGCDCSGFVQTLFALHGTLLPRDAWQQALVGEPVAGDPLDHLPGDLLFFSDREDGHVTHVAVGEGAGRILHVAVGRGGLAADRLDMDEPYTIALRSQLRAVRHLPDDR